MGGRRCAWLVGALLAASCAKNDPNRVLPQAPPLPATSPARHRLLPSQPRPQPGTGSSPPSHAPSPAQAPPFPDSASGPAPVFSDPAPEPTEPLVRVCFMCLRPHPHQLPPAQGPCGPLAWGLRLPRPRPTRSLMRVLLSAAFAERRERSFSRSWSDPTPMKADTSHDSRDSRCPAQARPPSPEPPLDPRPLLGVPCQGRWAALLHS